METLLLTRSEVQSLVTMKAAVAAVEEAFSCHARGDTLMPPKVYLELTDHHGDFRAMPAYLADSAGLKWVNAHPENPTRHGLPSVRGMYILSDPTTADPLAIMDATWLTAIRTGAAAAVAARHLARQDASSVGFVGAGAQARTILSAMQVVFEDLEIVAADQSTKAVASFVAEVGGQTGTVQEASACDIVCTATPSHLPIVERGWIRPGAHINAMGADGHGKQELDSRILLAGRVVVDDISQAQSSGEINVPLAKGEFEAKDVHASLGEIILGLKPGRTNDRQITIFDSTGLAIQDLALARLIYTAAQHEGVGRSLDFFQ